MQCEELLNELDELILENKRQEAFNLCNSHIDLVKDNAFEVLPTITIHINEENEFEDAGKLKTCVELLIHIAGQCSYDDVILSLHKEIADTRDHAKFSYLLQPLKNALVQVPMSKFKYAIWCFNAMQTFVMCMPAPENFNLETPADTLKDACNDVNRINRIYQHVCDVYNAIIPSTCNEAEILIVVKYCLQLLGTPLVYLDMHLIKNEDKENVKWEKNKARVIGEHLVEIITCVYEPYKFLNWINFKPLHDDDDLEVSRLALGNFFYLVLAEKVNYERLPKVYDNIYVFQHILYYLTEFFNIDHPFVTGKGLDLAEATIIQNNLSHGILDDPIHSKFTEALSKVIIYSPIKEYRRRAVEIMRKYIMAFDNRGRYLLIHNAYNLVNHSGLMGYFITLYKDLLVAEFNSSCDFDIYFKGPKLSSLVTQFCFLHKKENSDFLELADQIIPVLNLLRYLYLRDKEDVTGIKGLLNELSDSFLEPLKKGLIISKGHYNLKMKELEEEASKGDNNEKKTSEVSVVIAGKELPKMTVVEKMDVVNSSMNAFDVMECLLARLVECVGY